MADQMQMLVALLDRIASTARRGIQQDDDGYRNAASDALREIQTALDETAQVMRNAEQATS